MFVMCSYFFSQFFGVLKQRQSTGILFDLENGSLIFVYYLFQVIEGCKENHFHSLQVGQAELS